MIESNLENKTAFGSAFEQSNKTIAKINELKSKKISPLKRNIGFVVLTILAFACIGIIGSSIVSGAIAVLVSLVVIAILGYGFRFLKQADPLIQQKTRNYLISKMTEEAKTNKIATLDNMVLSSAERLNRSQDALTKMLGYVNKLRSKVESSTSNTEMKQKKLATVVELYEELESNYEIGVRNHKDLKQKVADFKDMHEFSEIANEATAFALGSNELELEEMLGLAAFEQIETDFNTAMANIEVATKKLKYDED